MNYIGIKEDLIPYGKRYDKSWLLHSIEQECGSQFKAFQFHYVNNMAVFYVDSFKIAKNLVRVSKRIQGELYYKIVIIATPCEPPFTNMQEFPASSARVVSVHDTRRYSISSATEIKMCLQKRYYVMLESLDLSNLSNDPDLRSANIYFPLNKASSIEIILQILAECYPKLISLNLSHNSLHCLTGLAPLYYTTPNLKSLNLSYNKLCQVEDLELIQHLDLKDLWLEGNPISTSSVTSSYYRLYNMPTLVAPFDGTAPVVSGKRIQKLDGHIFKPNFFFEIGDSKALPPVQGSFFGNENIKSFLGQFLSKYFTLYDSVGRQALLQFYHENAVCSFSLPNVKFPKMCHEQLNDYWKENRNLMKVKKTDLRQQLIKYNRLHVVGFLCNLPKTEHNLQSFTVDVSMQTPHLLCFSVQGVFKEASVIWENLVRTFRRTFVIVPAPPGVSAQILNDQMVILKSYGSPESSSMAIALPGSPRSCNKTLDSEKMAVLQTFSDQTAMKTDWAQKCLEDNNWNIKQAGDIFRFLKDRGAIPIEAFCEPGIKSDLPQI
ncbi:nuclear RNA export factor 1 [Pelobates cultripes]|uniref:Nuclear RNA export factor 1 n=1 Tax=Pelobates cultripes TaxID=61616 RepID=A0AAD1RHR6_PELCU|nr:nuclear RNA export factor 1 [Pelobates cultripes]